MAMFNETLYSASPLDQFEIRSLLSIDSPVLNIHLSLTNIGLYLVSGTVVAILVSLVANNNNKVVSNS